MYFVFSFRFTFQGKILHDLQSLPILGQPSNARWCDTHCDIKPGRVKLHDRWNGIIWPWDMLSHLWSKKTDHSDFFLWAHDPKEEVQQKCADYWMHVSHLDFFKKLGITALQTTIPVAWHMDGVKVYKTHKAYVYSMASSLKKGNSLESKLLTLLFLDTYMKNRLHAMQRAKLLGTSWRFFNLEFSLQKILMEPNFPKVLQKPQKRVRIFVVVLRVLLAATKLIWKRGSCPTNSPATGQRTIYVKGAQQPNYLGRTVTGTSVTLQPIFSVASHIGSFCCSTGLQNNLLG